MSRAEGDWRVRTGCIGLHQAIVAACSEGSVGVGHARRSLERIGAAATESVAKLDSVEFLAALVRRRREEEPLDMLVSLGDLAADVSGSVSTFADVLSDPSTPVSYPAAIASALGGFGPIARAAVPALEGAAARGIAEAKSALTRIAAGK